MMTDLAEFSGILSTAQPDPAHEWLLPTKQVAEGFDTTPEAIRTTKSRHADELTEGQHWITVDRATLWTKRGVVRLGMFLTGDRAKAFRTAAENFIIGATETVQALQIATVNATFSAAANLEKLAEAVAEEIFLRDFPSAVDRHLQRMASDRLVIERCLGKLGMPIPAILSE